MWKMMSIHFIIQNIIIANPPDCQQDAVRRICCINIQKCGPHFLQPLPCQSHYERHSKDVKTRPGNIHIRDVPERRRAGLGKPQAPSGKRIRRK